MHSHLIQFKKKKENMVQSDYISNIQYQLMKNQKHNSSSRGHNQFDWGLIVFFANEN